MTAAKYLQPGDWITRQTLATFGFVMRVTAHPEPLGNRMLLLPVAIVSSGDEARYTVDQDEDYLVLGPENLARRRAVEFDLQAKLTRQLEQSQRVVEAIDTQLGLTQ